MLMCCLVKNDETWYEKNLSKLPKLGTYDVRKISPSCFDDKRCILADGINSLANCYGNVLNQ